MADEHIAKPEQGATGASVPGDGLHFKPGDLVRIKIRNPISGQAVAAYLRGREAVVESIVWRPGRPRHGPSDERTFRLAILLRDLRPNYTGSREDAVRIEVHETWLEEP